MAKRSKKGGAAFVSGPSMARDISADQSGAQSPRIASNPASALMARNKSPMPRQEQNMSGQTGLVNPVGRVGTKVPKKVSDPVTAQIKAVMKRGR